MLFEAENLSIFIVHALGAAIRQRKVIRIRILLFFFPPQVIGLVSVLLGVALFVVYSLTHPFANGEYTIMCVCECHSDLWHLSHL